MPEFADVNTHTHMGGDIPPKNKNSLFLNTILFSADVFTSNLTCFKSFEITVIKTLVRLMLKNYTLLLKPKIITTIKN